MLEKLDLSRNGSGPVTPAVYGHQAVSTCTSVTIINVLREHALRLNMHTQTSVTWPQLYSNLYM